MIRSKKHGIRPLIWVGLTTKQNTNSTPCPFCAGDVPVDDIICPHCQSAEEPSLTRKLLKTPEIQIELPLETELYELEQSKTDTSMIMDAPERHGHIRDSDESREMRIVTKVRQPEFAAELAKRYIKDWRFVYDDDGVPVPFEIDPLNQSMPVALANRATVVAYAAVVMIGPISAADPQVVRDLFLDLLVEGVDRPVA